jgi:hypothetical protein
VFKRSRAAAQRWYCFAELSLRQRLVGFLWLFAAATLKRILGFQFEGLPPQYVVY